MFLVIAVASVAFGWVDDDGRDSAFQTGSGSAGGDAITVNIIDTFQLDPAVQMLGLDYDDHYDKLVVMDNEADLIRAFETGTGTPSWTEPVPYSGTFGVCHDVPTPFGWYINSWTTGNLYYLDAADTWSTAYANPAGIYGRGLDFDEEGYIWEAASSPPSTLGFYRINAASGAGDFYPIAPGGPVSQLSGLAFYPDMPNPVLIVTTYDFPDFFFYEFDGSQMVYIGEAAPDVSGLEGSRGLTYSSLTETLFWSYKTTGDVRWIAEIEFDLMVLEQDTWGGIKAQF